MTQFTELLWCPRCKAFTPHRVYFCHLWGDPPDMYVQVGELCTRILSVTGRGKNRKTHLCSMYREYMLPVRDYNALVKMAKEDYPSEFNNTGESSDAV